MTSPQDYVSVKQLLDEAESVFKETGLTPRQLADAVRMFDGDRAALRAQRDELEAALRGMLAIYDDDNEVPYDPRLKAARAALSKVGQP